MIFSQLAQRFAEKPLFLLDFSKKLAHACPENQLFEFFRESSELLTEFLRGFSKKSAGFIEKIDDFLSILTVFSSEIDIIPELLQINELIGFFKENLKVSAQSLEILLNLLCHSANTIKFLLQFLKNELFCLIFCESREEFRRKALQSVCLCVICGDDEVFESLISAELLNKLLAELNHWEIDHLLVILKTLEKILFFCEEKSKSLDEQSEVFELLLELETEKRLEMLVEHNSKVISLLALHLLDRYFC